MIPEFVTERLPLRGLEPSDLDAYSDICSDPEVRRYLGDGHPLARSGTWREMALLLGHWSLRGFGQWAVVERATGEFVGRAGLSQPAGWPGLEVGWVLGRSHGGLGLATEAAWAAIGHAFENLGAQRLISLIHPDNKRASRVAERLGERYERQVEVVRMVHHLYGIDRASWPGSRHVVGAAGTG